MCPRTCYQTCYSASATFKATHTITYSGDDVHGKPIAVAAPHLRIPWQDRATFLGTLTSFTNVVNSVGTSFGTTDADIQDEIAPAINAIQQEIIRIDGFRTNIKEFHDTLVGRAGIPSPILKAVNGRLPNPAQRIPNAGENDHMFGSAVSGRYAWEDSHGQHSVVVEMGPFLVPSTEQHRYGTWLIGKKCMELTNYCDGINGPVGGRNDCGNQCCYEKGAEEGRGRTFVRITRTDPTGPELGIFWRLNPFGVVTRKTANARYHTQQVGIDTIR